ncbi:MAG TPA: Crp/Fnr family transcriptional regulator [Ignavibacteriaceae bacterium]|nr:Crp/Fnr family transcriptional regulator [Ignavibacteriaceae bacterium]
MNDEIEFLRYVPIFSDLNEETLELIYKTGVKKLCKKDTHVLLEHESGTALFIIKSGKVKVSRVGDDGKEVILSLLGESEFFGEMAIIDGLARSANIITMEETELFIIERDNFLTLIHNHPEIPIALIQILIQRIRAADMKIKALSIMDAPGKVGTIIMQLAEETGKIKNGVVEIEKIPFQHDLANMAGTSRETVSRTLHSFQKKGLIELDGSRVRILNYKKFKELYG